MSYDVNHDLVSCIVINWHNYFWRNLYLITHIVSVLFVVGSVLSQEHLPCDAVYMDPDAESFVCRCNSSYCDTFPPLESPEVGSFLRVESDAASSRFHRTVAAFAPDDGSTPGWSVYIYDSGRWQPSLLTMGARQVGLFISTTTDGGSLHSWRFEHARLVCLYPRQRTVAAFTPDDESTTGQRHKLIAVRRS